MLAALCSASCHREAAQAPVPLFPEPTAVIRGDSVACSACVIALDTIARLEPNDAVQFVGGSMVTYLPGADAYVIAPIADNGRIAIYDASGRFRGTALRAGEGPGEIDLIRFTVPLRGDTVAVIAQSGRTVVHALLTAKSKDHATPKGTVALSGIGLGDGRTAFNIYAVDRPSIAVVDRDFSLERGLGPTLADARFERDGHAGTNPKRLLVSLAIDGSGNLWSVTARYRLLIRAWGPSGILRVNLARDAEWFPPYDEKAEAAQEGLLPTQVRRLPVINGTFMVDSLLWLFATVPDSAWRQADRGDQSLVTIEGGSMRVHEREWDRFLDGIVEILDPATERVVARRRWPTGFSQVVSPGLVANQVPRTGGESYFVLLRPRLDRPR